MHSTTPSTPARPTLRRARRATPALLVAAALALGACGGDDEDDAGSADTVAPTSAETAPSETMPDATMPSQMDGVTDACSLLDPAQVETLLGTPGVTAESDTSLGAADGCRYAAGRTDVPAVTVGWAATLPMDDARGLACGDGAVTDVPDAGDGAIECLGVVLVPAGDGTLLVTVEDPTDLLDDASERQVLAAAAGEAAAKLV